MSAIPTAETCKYQGLKSKRKNPGENKWLENVPHHFEEALDSQEPVEITLAGTQKFVDD